MSYNQNNGDVKLLIKNIGAEDEGEYTCTARNLYGEAICSVFIQPEGKMFICFNYDTKCDIFVNFSSNYS